MAASERPQADSNLAWYRGITRYQWLVLLIPSAGWIFDVYESQIFNITRTDVLNDLLNHDEAKVKMYGEWFLAVFLLGGTFGGILFGSLADRYGRGPIMIVTILIYSIFSGLTYLVDSVGLLIVLRLLVSIGLGGEWAVAASLVAEVFPSRARSQASAMFHASSVFGTWLAAIAGIIVGSEWRYAYLLGIAPAILVLWIRASIKEPVKWQEQRAETDDRKVGNLLELLRNSRWNKRAWLGMLLAAVGLGTFWAVTVAGQDLAYNQALPEVSAMKLEAMGEPLAGEALTAAQHQLTTRRSRFAFGIIQAGGLGIGLLLFGPIAAALGRRRAFVLFHILGIVIVPIVCFVPQSYTQLLFLLPLFGFCTAGMHSGYAIYFPELFPTHLRATGTSFCFNGGRLAAVPVLLFSGWLKQLEGLDIRYAICGLALLYIFGIFLVLLLPETSKQELPN